MTKIFTDEERAELAKSLAPDAVRQREQAGQRLSYVEGWHVISELNRIFGADGWSRQTLEMICVHEGTHTSRRRDGTTIERQLASYRARVRLIIHDLVVRDGTGNGHGFGSHPGEAHESAAKEAETDALKRAAMTLGWPLGLALYDKEQEHVGEPEPAAEPAPAPPPRNPLDPIDELLAAPIVPTMIEVEEGPAAWDRFYEQAVMQLDRLSGNDIAEWYKLNRSAIDRMILDAPDVLKLLRGVYQRAQYRRGPHRQGVK